MVKNHSDSEKGNPLPPHKLLLSINSKGSCICTIPQTTAFVTPVVEHWLQREIAQWVHPMKDRSNDPSHHERTFLPQSYISLPKISEFVLFFKPIPSNSVLDSVLNHLQVRWPVKNSVRHPIQISDYQVEMQENVWYLFYKKENINKKTVKQLAFSLAFRFVIKKWIWSCT